MTVTYGCLCLSNKSVILGQTICHLELCRSYGKTPEAFVNFLDPHPMILTLPLISHFSALTQSGILGLLIVFSYLNKGARYVIGGLIVLLIGFKVLLPIVRWAYIIFKWVAMMGFYLHHFQVGIGFILSGAGGVILFVEGLLKELEKNRQAERERKREEEEKEREREREQEREKNARKRNTRKK